MPTGMEIDTPSGPRISLTDRLSRVIDVLTVDAAASGSKTYNLAGIVGQLLAFSVPATAGALHTVPHAVSVSGGVVSWSPLATATSGRISSKIYVVTR